MECIPEAVHRHRILAVGVQRPIRAAVLPLVEAVRMVGPVARTISRSLWFDNKTGRTGRPVSVSGGVRC